MRPLSARHTRPPISRSTRCSALGLFNSIRLFNPDRRARRSPGPCPPDPSGRPVLAPGQPGTCGPGHIHPVAAPHPRP